MLTVDIRQFLETVGMGQIIAKPLHGCVVPALCAPASLPVMLVQLIQLVDESITNALIFGGRLHIS